MGRTGLEAAPAPAQTRLPAQISPLNPPSQSLSPAESPQQPHCGWETQNSTSPKPWDPNPSPILPASHPSPTSASVATLPPPQITASNPASGQPTSFKGKGVCVGVGGWPENCGERPRPEAPVQLKSDLDLPQAEPSSSSSVAGPQF